MRELRWAGGTLHVVRELARGGMGSVELALRDQGGFRRAFAVKRLHPALRGDPEALRRFVDEASLAAELRHPNVVSVLDVGHDAMGPFIVMELVHGLSLREVSSAELPPQLALRILTGVAEALRAAHAHDLAHRDVSPGNVLVGFDGTVRLIDFGLARAVQDERSRELLRGTVGYMSPEQLRFEAVDTRTDLFSLGVLAFECLTGERLYGDADARIAARRILDEPPPDLRAGRPETGDDVSTLVSALLAKQPDERPADADAVITALRRATHERVLDEGPLDLADWMATTFPDALAEWRARMAASWRLLEDAAPETEPRPARRRWPSIVAAVAVALGAAALLLWPEAPPPDGARARKADVTVKLEPIVTAPAARPEAEPAEEATPRARPPRSSRRRARRRRPAPEAAGTETPGGERRLWRW